MRTLLILFMVLMLSGCATTNFTKLPTDYRQEVEKIVLETTSKLKLNNHYTFYICKDTDTSIPGIPEIVKTNIFIPEPVIKYIYKYYYTNRSEIIVCLLLHEIAHTEYGLKSGVCGEQHYFTDKTAIDKLMLPYTQYTASDFYSMLRVLSDYWDARKGALGHIGNVSYNTAMAWVFLNGGTATFHNFFATDVKIRLKLLKKDYPGAKFTYQKSSISKN